MKVKLPENYRSVFTLDDLDNAKSVIAYEKDDDETASGWLMYAAREATKNENDYVIRIVEASAEAAKNCDAWNMYGDTERMDVWISGIAETCDGFLKIGAYLSDIWQSGAEDYYHKMFIARYARMK